MSLTEIDRQEVVKYRLEKAKDTFAQVPVLMENKFYVTAANRLYYACYYAAIALLIKEGHKAHTHSGVKILLGLHYFTKNKIEKSYSKLYSQLFSLRISGDYEDMFEVDESDVKRYLQPAENFIAEIERLINDNN
jgi:uncharacterized protein (UPF0332 family)